MKKEMLDLGCIETTSKTQMLNGTICFFDPQTQCHYMSYANGYIRRRKTFIDYFTGNPISRIYQLNSTRQEPEDYGNGFIGTRTIRIMILDESERMRRLASACKAHRAKL